MGDYMSYFSTRVELAIRALTQVFSNPPWVDKTLNRVRETAIIESGTVTTVSTVTTVTGMTNIDSQQGRLAVYGASNAAWALCVRSRIS
jgi:hypothetical protein